MVDEAATRLKKQVSVRNAVQFLETLEDSELFRLEPVSEDVFRAATDRFVEWTDLDASLTDFVVAAHASDLGVDHVLTFDGHYEAFDVTILLYRRVDR